MSGATSELKPDLEEEVLKIKLQMGVVESEIADLSNLEQDLVEFVKFGLEYTNILKEDWWLLDQEQRQECVQLLFPEGFIFESSEKVRTTDISPLYRLAATKKNLDFSRDSLLVELDPKQSHLILHEVDQWRKLIGHKYQQEKLGIKL